MCCKNAYSLQTECKTCMGACGLKNRKTSMNTKALIFDLDNTIYPVASISEKLFKPLFELIGRSGEYRGDFQAVKQLIMRKPFQYVAEKHGMSAALREEALQLLSSLTYAETMKTFSDYDAVKKLPQDKFLVTAGFTKLQLSKIQQLNIENDFKRIYVVDQMLTADTKKSVFENILVADSYEPREVLVVGDDPHSEIKAAMELGMKVVLYDSLQLYKGLEDMPRITGFANLAAYL